MTLEQFFKDLGVNIDAEFSPYVTRSSDGVVKAYWEDCSTYLEQVNEFILLHKNLRTHEVVGVTLIPKEES